MKNAILMLVASGLVLSGCGGREAHPVAAVSAVDRSLDCASISREFAANERQVVSLIKERSAGAGKNVALAAVGVFMLPALFFIDPKSPEKVEIDALRNRNSVLADIARSKKCPQPKSQLKEVYARLDRAPAPPAGSSDK